jgi:hypothetical protein
MFYLSTFIIKFVLLFFGLFSNIIGLIVFARKSIDKKIKTKPIYQTILFIDSVYLFSQIFQDTFDSLNIRLSHMSIIACKLRGYWNFSIGSTSIWYLVYITVERYLQIKYQNLKLLQKKKFQIFIILLVIAYSLVSYSLFAIFYNIIITDTSNLDKNETYVYCDIDNLQIQSILLTFDTINSIILPFIIITIFSCLLIYTVISSRIKALRMQSQVEKNKLLKDIRLSVSILIINLTIFIPLPIQIANYFFYDLDGFIYDILCCISYSYYCIDTYILYVFNSNFKNEFLLMFKLKK